MERTPRLLTEAAPEDASGLVLLLHGGANRRGNPMVSPAQLSVLRMIPLAKRIERAGRGRLGVFRLLNTHRGWDSTHTPVDDVAWALGELRDRYDDRPVCLVGHSLGGRAALLAGSSPGVVSVVALNPWVYPTDDADLAGRRVLIIHGTDDRVASIERSTTVARRLALTTDVTFRTVEGGRHAMLRQGAEFERPAAEFVVQTLVG
ncbi:MAG TPA: alpha/beta fold hydrolase [Nocardioides sp.]|nr:alpha/beta fold hydrolase [Nocardioides sp.]